MPREVDYDHSPPIRLREVNAERTDTIPPMNDPDHIFAMLPKCHARKTNGSKATSAGSDKHAIAKVRRLRGENKPKPKRTWPSRDIPARPFEKRKKK